LTRNRVALLPNLPTAHEQGLVNVEADVWFGFSFPRNTPDLIVRRLHQATVEAMATSAVRQRVEGLGATLVEPERATPEYLAGFVRSEIEKWAPPIRPVAYRWNDPRTTHDFRNGSKASGQQGGWHVRFTPDRARACRTVVFPAGAQRSVVGSLLHRGCMSTPDLFMRRFAGEPFDPKRRGKEAIWARWKSRVETDFFGEGELMVRKPRAPAMSKEAMRQESERLVREAMARNVTIVRGKTRLDVKCSKCGAPNRVSAKVDHGRVEYACKECGHKQKTF